MNKATSPRPPLDARVIGLPVEVSPDDARDLLFCQEVWLFDAAAPEQGQYCMHPVSLECVWADGVARRRKEQLADRYRIEAVPRRVGTAQVDRLAAELGPRSYRGHGGTGVGYDEASYEDQLEGLVSHFRDNPLVGAE